MADIWPILIFQPFFHLDLKQPFLKDIQPFRWKLSPDF